MRMTHGQISCTKIFVQVPCTRNLDHLSSALQTGRPVELTGAKDGGRVLLYSSLHP